MHELQILIDPQTVRADASRELIEALDLLLRYAGARLSNGQRIAVLSVIIASGRALQRARGTDRDASHARM